MKRKFTILNAALALLVLLALPMGMWGQTREVETFTFSELGYGNAEAVTTVEGTNVTLTFDQGTNANNTPKYFTTGTGVRMYTGNTLEVALNDQEGETRITAIDFTFSGTYTGSLQNWTGSETSVSFTNTDSGQARIQVIEVTYSEGGVAPITYTVTYNANVAGVNPVVDTYVEGANVTLRPANTFNYDGHTFSEWNTQADGDGDPYDAGDEIANIQANLQLYAIWIEDTPSDAQWVLTNLADLTENDVFVIVGNNGSNYAMSNNNGTGSAPAAVAVTVDNDLITSNVTSTIQWTLSGNATDGYTFYPSGSTTTWLYCTNTNNGVRVGTNTSKTFVVDDGYLKHSGTNRYVGIYDSQDWRCYTSTGGNIANQTFAFYKKVSGGVLPPSITANNVSIDYNATSGAIAYTINNAVQGGVLSATTESDWLTIGTVGATVPFTCSMNDYVERTATVTLTYTYNSDQTISKNVTVTQASNPNAPGSETNPYTVAQARAAIDAGMGTQGVYATGIVSEILTPYNSTYGNITFNMVDEVGDEVFLQAYRCGGEEAANVAIGDVVVVYGNLTKHGSTYEFGQGCEVVSLIHLDIPSITVTPATVNFAATGTNGIQMDSLTIVYENIMVTNYQSFTVQFYDNQGNETTMHTDWLIVGVTGTNEEGYVVRCVVGDNDGEARTA
ncbi:MAG: InlB B-repeat-containing protein, partial [Bacteroidales bacterium]|nr:InlB B-repeat-containing protein [Bacteroidales bacterium]